MELYLIRHGQTVANAQQRFAGWSDTPLTELGEAQAIAAGDMLRGITFDRYYCSDLYRARQTFRLIFGAEAEAQCVYSPDIREANSGDLVGRLIAEVRQTLDGMDKERLRRWDYTPFHGENPATIRARVRRFLDDIAALQGVERVVAVTHGGALQAMIAEIMGAVFPRTPVICDNCGVSVLKTREDGWAVKRWNVTGTL